MLHQLDNIEIEYDVEIPTLVENNFSGLKHHSYIRGYHAYMDTWTPIIGDDNLLNKQEKDNKHDKNAIAVLQCNGSGPLIVVYVPICYLDQSRKRDDCPIFAKSETAAVFESLEGQFSGLT